MRRLRTIAANMLIVLFLVLTTLEGLHPLCYTQDWLRWRMAPAVNFLGLQQGYWSVFTPTVDRGSSLRIHMRFLLKDGAEVEWESPDWRKASAFEKFYRFREINYYKAVANAVGPRPASHLAKCVARELHLNSAEVVRVQVQANTLVTPSPWPEGPQPLAPDSGILNSVLLCKGPLP